YQAWELEKAAMDQNRFDDIAKSLAKGTRAKGTRRRVLAGAAGALLGAIGFRRASDAQALPGPPWEWSGIVCGGIASLPCPDGYDCHIDWSDPTCRTDCMGWCRRVPAGEPTNPCAAILCIEGTTCCENCGGICVPNDVSCSDELCAGERCGPVVCPAGEVCCNESCGYCTPPDGACTEEFCISEECGPNLCGLGEYCCNESCGTCAPIGGACTLELCVPEPGGEPCGPTTCAAGEVCCNESCGICTPPDGFCIQIACV
ncbi:MAG: hypothetical protein M3509_12255, partial [Chloroflexota bacterium]|nr:hypothetical protein [Chloroflexota bacterium]